MRPELWTWRQMFSKVRPPCASGMVGFPSEKSLVSSHSERAYILLLNCLTVADLRVSVLSRPIIGKMPLSALMWRVLENLEVQMSSGILSRNAFQSSSEMSGASFPCPCSWDSTGMGRSEVERSGGLGGALWDSLGLWRAREYVTDMLVSSQSTSISI